MLFAADEQVHRRSGDKRRSEPVSGWSISIRRRRLRHRTLKRRPSDLPEPAERGDVNPAGDGDVGVSQIDRGRFLKEAHGQLGLAQPGLAQPGGGESVHRETERVALSATRLIVGEV